MRPYLAIIKDSFREALASRILWLLFVLITLLLLVIAPLGFREQVTRGVEEDAVADWPHFWERLRDEAAKPQPSPAKHIVSLLDDDSQTKLREFQIPEPNDAGQALRFIGRMHELRRGVNATMARPDFYDQDAWKKVVLVSDEARKLVNADAAKLSGDDLARRNRLLVESAYPDQISTSPPTSVSFRYLWFDFGEPLPIRKTEFVQILETIVSTVMNWFVGVIGVFVAIVVTSPIIPQTFDPGSLNLLLSKPVSRTFVFVAKFFGGCAFIALNATYLICGLCLILGWRFGVWDGKLLLSIPVYIFMFAIYYSVSALAGLIWRNAIVSVAVSILFWLCCWVVGTTKIGLEQWVLNKVRVTEIILTGSELIAINEMSATYEWNAANQDWQEIFLSNSEEDTQRRLALAFVPSIPPELRPIGPIYDSANQQLIATYRSFRSGQMVMNVGKRSDHWKSVRGASASIGTVAMLPELDGKILFVSNLGLYRLIGDPSIKPEPVKVFGVTLPLPNLGPFESVGPESGLIVTRPIDAKLNQDTGRLAIFCRGSVTLLNKSESGRYEIVVETKLNDEPSRSAVLGFGGETILLGHEDGRVQVLDAATLKPRAEFSVEPGSSPRFIAAAPEGNHFAIVFHNGTLWTYDAKNNAMTKARAADQGDISCATFSAPDRLLVGHHATRVTEYDLQSWSATAQHSPAMPLLERCYRYIIVPFYFVFPKPGELDKTVQYLLTGKETVSTGHRQKDQSAAQQQLHPWPPVWSSLAFVVAVLTLGCLYLERQEF